MSQLLSPKSYPKRTNQQNKALHVYFKLISDALNDAGLDMRKVLKPTVDIPWNPQNVKEFLWKPVMRAQLLKRSTTELTTVEIDEIFDTINRHLGEKFGIHEPFPSYDNIVTTLRDASKGRTKQSPNNLRKET